MAESWIEVRVIVPLGWQELVAGVLAEGLCTSAVIGRTSIAAEPAPEGCEIVRTYLPAHAYTEEARAALARDLAHLADATGAAELAGLTPTFRPLPPEDYATSWRKVWRPFRVGRLCVLPPWKEFDLRPGDVRLTLEPGGVFGSGRHATTRMCLRFLQERVDGDERIVDAGAGTGILSVAAALLGAREVLGFDVDPHARRAGDELARANGVAERCVFRTGGFEQLAGEPAPFDAALANIYSDVIQAHATEMAARLRPGGWFVFSGCPYDAREPTLESIGAAGLTVEDEERRGRWHTFAGVRGA